MNEIVLVGHITKDFEIREKDNIKYTLNTLAVDRNSKDKNGQYQTDFIPFVVFGNIVPKLANFCKKGALIGISGQLHSYNNNLQVYAEKIKFLSSNKVKTDENVENDKKN